MILKPLTLNEKLQLNNRIFMAPMTRNHANDDFTPNQAMADYYAKRANAGLIITEGTIISPQSIGYSNQPGIYTREQIEGWKKVTEKVHAKGGKIFCQIWHVGRVSHPNYLNGELPVGPSETEMKGRIPRAQNLFYGKNRALAASEIKQVIADFRQASRNAIEAGFDGVELHGANGYLIDQFLHHSTNLRTDEYGKTPENMVRFAIEAVQACGNEIGFERVAIRLSPAAYLNEIEENPEDQSVFIALLKELNKLAIAYVHNGNFDDKKHFESLNNQTMSEFLRKHYDGVLVACGGYTAEEAEEKMRNGAFDCVAIGRPFIANPDLIQKLNHHEKLCEYDASMLKDLT